MRPRPVLPPARALRAAGPSPCNGQAQHLTISTARAAAGSGSPRQLGHLHLAAAQRSGTNLAVQSIGLPCERSPVAKLRLGLAMSALLRKYHGGPADAARSARQRTDRNGAAQIHQIHQHGRCVCEGGGLQVQRRMSPRCQ